MKNLREIEAKRDELLVELKKASDAQDWTTLNAIKSGIRALNTAARILRADIDELLDRLLEVGDDRVRAIARGDETRAYVDLVSARAIAHQMERIAGKAVTR